MATTEELLQDALQQDKVLLKQQTEFLKEIKQLNENIAYLTNKLYGHHSEKMGDPNQQSLFEEDGSFTDPEQTGEQSEEPEVISGESSKARKTEKKRSEIISTNLPTEDEIYDSPAKCCKSGHDLEKNCNWRFRKDHL